MNDLKEMLTRLSACAHLISAELDDLIVLAYEKKTGDTAKVKGGDVIDLTLVGDERARTALHGIERYAMPLLENLDNALNLLHSGKQDPAPRTRKQITKKNWKKRWRIRLNEKNEANTPHTEPTHNRASTNEIPQRMPTMHPTPVQNTNRANSM